MTRTILTNARIAHPDEVRLGGVEVSDGVITVIDSASSLPAAEDLDGDLLLPGLIDIHTDNLEKHLAPRPGVKWNPTSAAINHDAQIVAAGITTVFDSLRLGSEQPERRALLDVMLGGIETARERGLLRSDHMLHLRCDLLDPDLIRLLDERIEDPRLRFMTMSDNSAARNVERYRKKLQDDPKVPKERVEELLDAALKDRPGLTLANRREVVVRAAARGVPVASHDDGHLWHIEQAKELGLRIAEFPLSLEVAEAAHEQGMTLVMGSPNLVRGFSHAGGVSVADIARRRKLGVISSDYVPSSLLQGVFALAGGDICYPLHEAVRAATKAPADIMGLSDRGSIEVGKRADLIRVKSFDDMFVVRAVWRAGERVY